MVFAVFKNTTFFKNIYKYCYKIICNVMKAELLETPPNRPSQIVRIRQTYLFLKACSLSPPFTPQVSYCYYTSKDGRPFDLMKTFQKCSEFKSFQIIFQSEAFHNHKWNFCQGILKMCLFSVHSDMWYFLCNILWLQNTKPTVFFRFSCSLD